MGKRIIISSGDPAGCGPDITLSVISQYPKKKAAFIVVGDEKVFIKNPLYKKLKKSITFIDFNTPGIENLKKGRPTRLSGLASLNYLKKALEIISKEKVRRLVTAPISKEAVAKSLPGFCGHTEYLASHFKVSRFAMMMASGRLKTILLTRHLPLRKAIVSLNEKCILDTLCLTHSCLKNKFKIKKPKIVFSSVNPHAGVDTFLEKEDKRILNAIKSCHYPAYGPYPADTLFTAENVKKYDCVICPYHDQGMIPFKMLAFKDGVNLTLGLPIIRTSPAHGTAFDLMRQKRKPFDSSMSAAIDMAAKLKI